MPHPSPGPLYPRVGLLQVGGSLGRDSRKLEGHRAVLQCSQSTQQAAKCSFPSYTSNCWKPKQKEKSGLK